MNNDKKNKIKNINNLFVCSFFYHLNKIFVYEYSTIKLLLYEWVTIIVNYIGT